VDGSGNEQQQQQQLRAVVQLVVRSSSHDVLLAIREHADAWVNDISQVGLNSQCTRYYLGHQANMSSLLQASFLSKLAAS
jgi:hypothetical protein